MIVPMRKGSFEEEGMDPDRKKCFKQLKELYHTDLNDWEHMPGADRNDKDGSKLRAYRHLGMEGKPGTYLEIIKKQTFPNCTADRMWELSGGIKDRIKWDKRICEPKFISYSESPFQYQFYVL